MQLTSRELTVIIDVDKAVFDVRHNRTRAQWRMDRADVRDLVVRRGREEFVLNLAFARIRQADAVNASTVRLTYAGFRGMDSSLAVAVVIRLQNAELIVAMDVNDADPDLSFDSLYWPRAFLLPKSRAAYWIFPDSGGSLIPAVYHRNKDARLGWKPALKCHGAVNGRAGFLGIWETPFDVYLAETNSHRTGPKLLTRWIASLGRFGYTRQLRFVFRDRTDYADLIRTVYRPWARQCGYLRTLRAKTQAVPAIRSLAGGMIFHQNIAVVDRRKLVERHITFAQAAAFFKRIVRETGVKHGCYHLDGWCRQGYDALHPDVFPPCPEAGGADGMARLAAAVKRQGYHFGLHDNYNLFFPDAERYRDRHAVWGPDLEPYRDQFRAGGLNMVLSPVAAREMIIANYIEGQNVFRRRWAPAGKTYNLGFCYFDQYLIKGGIDEDFNPAHSLTRQQFVQAMLANIGIMSDRLGCITSSEHMFDFGVAAYDVNGNREGVAPGMPAPDRIPVPLWNLAFHECMVVTLGDYGLKLTPGQAAMAGLIGGLVHIKPSTPGDFADTERRIGLQAERVKVMAPLRRLHKEVMYRECTGSRLCAADGSVQETDFEGIRVRADLNRAEITVRGSRNADGTFDFNNLDEYTV